MENKDIINELKNIKDKLRDSANILNGLIKEIEKKEDKAWRIKEKEEIIVIFGGVKNGRTKTKV